jgi:hypothetical protein
LSVDDADLALTLISIQSGVIVALIVLIGRLRERLARLEEWARIIEKRLNGGRD